MLLGDEGAKQNPQGLEFCFSLWKETYIVCTFQEPQGRLPILFSEALWTESISLFCKTVLLWFVKRSSFLLSEQMLVCDL